jgi:hypothetical protein
MRFTLVISILVLAAVFSAPTGASNGNFVPDWSFKGSALTDWQPLGQVDWRAENGEIIGVPRSPEGGWLFLNQSFQDVQIAFSVRCAAACRTGVLLRAERTADGGRKGILLSFSPGDTAAYAVTIDGQGRETNRERLRAGGGQTRFVANPDGTLPSAQPPRNGPLNPAPGDQAAAGRGAGAAPAAAGRAGGGGGGRGRPDMPQGLTNPYPIPSFEFQPAEWNEVDAEIEANLVRGWLAGGPENGAAAGAADEDKGRYGPVALWVAGTGEVRIKDLKLREAGKRVMPTESVSPRFTMLRLSNFTYGWTAVAADVNRDGVLDVVSYPHYYLGPDFTVEREISLSQVVNPSTTYPNGLAVQSAFDWTGDGWPDVVTSRTLFVNPGKELRRWDRIDTEMGASGECTAYRDVNGDGIVDVINNTNAGLTYSYPNPANRVGPWITVNVSGPGPWGSHGVGGGDVNGDGRVDLLNPFGWWEQPASNAAQGGWTYHLQRFADWGHYVGGGPGGAEIIVYDVNGDGRNDVVSSMAAHGWGLAWFEQQRNAAGAITFVRHDIMGDFASKNAGNVTFSELHGLTMADMNGDGIQDIVTGKRYWAHQESFADPDPMGVPALYIFRTVRNRTAPGGAEFVPELVHNRSGVGSTVGTADLNKDGAMDIMTATKLGTFVFLGKPR